jgi:hypothetical protein
MPMKIPRLHSSLSTRKISLSDFWEEFPRLSKLALVACSLVCSTSSAERNFSLQGLIHSKYRDPKVMKMAYIKTNYKHMQPNKKNIIESEELEMLESQNEKEEDQEEEEEKGVEV